MGMIIDEPIGNCTEILDSVFKPRERKVSTEDKFLVLADEIARLRKEIERLKTAREDHEELILSQARISDQTLDIDLYYPRPQSKDATKVVLGLRDIRASDGVRLSYDFERDGWIIEQASIFEWEGDDDVCDPDWQEVAFIESWGREKGDEESDA